MPVKDFMSEKVVYVSPDTTVAHATDLMRERGLRRLPVIENDKLVGLITEGTMAEASPSKATALSIFEMNYLLNKTKIGSIMIKDVITISPYASLEDAVYTMMKHHIGVLPVVDNGQVYGIITDKDIFKAFLQISGYGEEGIRLTILADDTIGTLAKIVDRITDDNLNIKRTVIASRKTGKVVLEIQIDGMVDLDTLKGNLLKEGIQVSAIEKTTAKSLD